MKKIILSILAGFLLLSAISLDVSAAKKSSKLSKEAITEMSETIDFDLFKRGIEICTERGKLNLGYLKGIIKRWLDSNITTYEQLKAYELQMKANKNSDNKNYDISKEKEKEKPSVVQLQPFDFSEVRKELEEMGIEL